MKLVEPSVENITPQKYDLNSVLEHIELCGRTAYQSQDKKLKPPSKVFVENLIKNGHGSVLEHGTVYLKIEGTLYDTNYEIEKYIENKYTKVTHSDAYGCAKNTTFYITTNYRVIVENDWFDDLQYLCEPTEYHEKRHTIKVICDRGISHELVRHRVFSFTQESTRYCNYSKDKFENEITFIIPCCYGDMEEGSYKWTAFNNYSDDMWCGWRKDSEPIIQDKNDKIISRMDKFHYFFRSLELAEEMYFALLNYDKQTPQQARSVLPNSLKTEIVITGFYSDWKNLLKLRSPLCGATGIHPDMAILGNKIANIFDINSENI